jgi:hypothetical protein
MSQEKIRHLKCPVCGLVLPLNDGPRFIDYQSDYSEIARHSESHDPPVKGAWLENDSSANN